MTERQLPYGATAECLHCGVTFVPRRAGHVFHSQACRHAGERRPDEREATDHEQVARLFDESRDPDELVKPTDWHPSSDPRWHELDAGDRLRRRRHWYSELSLLGRL